MYLTGKHLFGFVFLICFLHSVKSFSQADSSVYTNNLLIINNEILKSDLHISNSCDISFKIPVDDLLQHALLYDKKGNGKCCKAILNAIIENKIKLTALQVCHFHLTMAEYFTLHQTYDSAFFYAELANKESAGKSRRTEKGEALLLLSQGGLKQRNISAAYAWADSALLIARQTGNNNLEGKVLLQLALCTRRHFTAIANRSFPYFLMARDKAISTSDSITLATVDLYLGTDYFELNNWAQGFPFFSEGISTSLHRDNINLRYLSFITLGYSFELTKNYKGALLMFIKGLKLSQQLHHPYDIQHCYHDIAKSYQGLYQYDSALVYTNLAATVQGVDSFWANVWETKASIYNDLGNYKMATAMYKKSIDWFREDFLYRNQDQLSGYEARLNTKEKEIQVTQQKKRAIQLEWMIGGVCTLLIVAAFAFIMQRKARRKLFLQNNIIQKQRSELERSLGEKEILLKEIHHRVKNNLSVISSLLELQSNGISDQTAKDAIAVGQNRVSSIALIHQRLYQHDNLAAIELASYIHDLLLQVGCVFKKPDTQIITSINVPETLLDIDTAVPLGLIINELITNTYKYAFEKHKEGFIKIHLQQENQGEFILTYADNGPGISDNINIKKTTSLGLRLITRLSKQIGGDATYKYKNGSTFVIRFKDSNKRNNE